MDENRDHAAVITRVLVTSEADGSGVMVKDEEREDEGAEKGGEKGSGDCYERAHDRHGDEGRMIRGVRIMDMMRMRG